MVVMLQHLPAEAVTDGLNRGARGLCLRQCRNEVVAKIVVIASGDGLPLAVSVESASLAGCKLVEAVLVVCFLDELPSD